MAAPPSHKATSEREKKSSWFRSSLARHNLINIFFLRRQGIEEHFREEMLSSETKTIFRKKNFFESHFMFSGKSHYRKSLGTVSQRKEFAGSASSQWLSWTPNWKTHRDRGMTSADFFFYYQPTILKVNFRPKSVFSVTRLNVGAYPLFPKSWQTLSW